MFIKILAYLIIPAYTVLFTRGYGWFTTNFSVIGNILDKKKAFFLWGIIVGGYFYMIDRRIKRCIRLSPLCSGMIPAALVLLFCAVTTPYLPEEFPFKSFLHIIFAFVSTSLLLLFLLTVSWGQFRRRPGSYGLFLAGELGIIIVAAVLLDLVGIVSSALEIFITITTVILSERLLSRIARQEVLLNG